MDSPLTTLFPSLPPPPQDLDSWDCGHFGPCTSMKAMGWGLGGSLALRRGLGGGGVGGTSTSSLASSQMQPGSSMEHEGGGASSFARATDAALLGGGAGWRLLTGHESGQVRRVWHFPWNEWLFTLFMCVPSWYLRLPLLMQYVMLRPFMSRFTHSHTL